MFPGDEIGLRRIIGHISNQILASYVHFAQATIANRAGRASLAEQWLGGHALEEVRASLGPAPATPYGNKRPRRRPRLQRSRVVKRPKLKDILAERILSEADVHKLLVTADRSPTRRRTPVQGLRARRNYVLLLLLYAADLRARPCSPRLKPMRLRRSKYRPNQPAGPASSCAGA